ncbi:hypothetical protein [Candidatus Halocynthiibacter alkanivorans]|uniref:hypothetical protein n=1 Tax=Candidatus Halocynthiibacter alkanivorans TaxID=2267619 RepID=UPI000DF2C785|nr:hypothetical protein [Candidatus Halocynthiibacter alkanivorans]
MLMRFLRAKGKSLMQQIIVWGILLTLKLAGPEFYGNSRFSGLGDLFLIVGLPAGFVWEWVDFKKNMKNKKQ